MKLLTVLLLSISFLYSQVNLNNATQKELTELKGIGSKKAKNILTYRKSIKCFKTVNELTNVKGIGKSTLEKNKNNLILGKCNK